MYREELRDKICHATDMVDELIVLNTDKELSMINSYIQKLKSFTNQKILTDDEALLISTYSKALSIMNKVSFKDFKELTSVDNDDWDYRSFIASVMLRTDLCKDFSYDYMVSTHIGEFMTAGFGRCNDIGDFTFPLPVNINGRQYVISTMVDDYYMLYSDQ